jgi:thiol-disulfide isomerase/thioredoxin
MSKGADILSRRIVLAGMAGLAAARTSAAADTDDELPVGDSPIAHGVLANNPLALAFESAPSTLPDVNLWGPNGRSDISELKGRTILMPLWAEWCAPCLGEIPDFSTLQRRFGNAKFAVVPILTGTRKQMTPPLVAKVFEFLHASALEPLLEDHLGDRLMSVMARRKGRVEIPCNLLVAPDGHVVAREFGLRSADDGPTTRRGLISRAENGESLSLWGKDAGAEFAAAMANGFLG